MNGAESRTPHGHKPTVLRDPCLRPDRPRGIALRLKPPPVRPSLPSGELNAATVAQALGALMPEGAIVSDESATSDFALPAATVGAPPYDWLALAGGAWASGCPSRRVPRSVVPTDRSLIWKPTAAACTPCSRSGPKAMDLLDLSRPNLDCVIEWVI